MNRFDIVGHRKIWYIFSSTIIIAGLICMFTKGFNLGIDFTGGTLLNLEFEEPVDINDVRTIMNDYVAGNTQIQMAGAQNDSVTAQNVMIRTRDLSQQERENVLQGFKEKLGDYKILREEKVGATIGSELIMKAVWAALISWLLIIIYISYRFEFKFGLAAVLALVHDTLVVLSVFSLTQKEIDSSFIAAILTVVGYSVTDTIVIFDRIRENLKLHFKRGGDIEALANRSIYQTLTRSIYTVTTILVTTIALYIFGGDTTRDFAFALMVGFAFGSYSSIFTATPLWVTFREYSERRQAKKRMKPRVAKQ
ncbi:protein translocase subunit SecF [Pectinatus cerevisiiphilus]|uniref:Protein-export membrane protein SecF n=1 Tax=Pectinatus cerevisiiphilus TaxID=86956 RepID=A0A4R3KB97_9FIRM|nr:protein translocase subunit SecF [Pectinatus cerevisiiphilus]TCS80416.1 preprotein translocase subunit SecF [Pectinatus cerevisiiphilus]